MPLAGPSNTKPDADSATESSDDEHLVLMKPVMTTRPSITCAPAPTDKEVDLSTLGSELPKEAKKQAEKSALSDSSSVPGKPPPSKKAKRAASSSSDSEESDKVVAAPSTRRGARQPIKRGGKRF